MAGLSKRRKRFYQGLFTAIAIGAVICVISYFNLFHGIQLQISDMLFRAAKLNQKVETADNIVIVGIDDKSLDQLGHFSSWPRSYQAQLIDKLAEAEARVIVFDILFAEAAPDDEQMVASLQQAGNVILPLASTLTLDMSSSTRKEISWLDIIRPLKIFEDNALAIGHANMLPDEDGIVRRLPLVITYNERTEPALALATVAKYLRRSQVLESPAGDNSLPLAGRDISIDSTNSMLINYTGASAAPLNFEIVPYVDVLNGNVAAGTFQDKIVLIGATATGLGDVFWTPMGHMMNGVELHARAIHTILTGSFLKEAPVSVTMMSIFALVLLCGLAVLRFNVYWATISAVSLCAAYFLTTFFFFDNGMVLNMLYPPLAAVGAFVGVNLHNAAYEHSEKVEITRTFGRYVSPSVAEKILTAREEDTLKLGGDEHEVTVAFADVRGFTGISEKMPSGELVRVLNSYLTVIIDAVLECGGVINKFDGDSVMAIWNVPVESDKHAFMATKAALSAQRNIRKLQERETAMPRMEFGIGINTGQVIAGNMGSKDRLEYSVIGDTVNSAARITDNTPGGKVWIGANTFEQVKDFLTAFPLEPLRMKGKHEPVTVYEVIDSLDERNYDQGNLVQRIGMGRV